MAATGETLAAQAAEDAPQLDAWRDEVRRHALAHVARRPPQAPRALRIGVLVLILLVHGLGFVALSVMRERVIARDELPVEVRLLDTVPEPPLPTPQTHVPRASAPKPVQRAPSAAATTARIVTPEPPPVPSLQIYNADGSIRLPAEAAQAPTPEQAAAELMQRGHNIVHCRSTRFANAFTRDESVGDKVARKYLVWIGMADMQVIEARAARRKADAAAACDG